MANSDTVWLVGDIGATNARFGLVSPEGATFIDAESGTTPGTRPRS